jgi:ankyrin repeat protein
MIRTVNALSIIKRESTMRIKFLIVIVVSLTCFLVIVSKVFSQPMDSINLEESQPSGELFAAAKSGDLETVKRLIASGAPLEEIGERGATALIIASLKENEEVIKTLVMAGANVNAQAEYGITAMFLAVDKGHEKIVKLLIDSGSRMDIKEDKGATLVAAAAHSNRINILKLLIKAGADFNGTKLHKKDVVLKGTPLMVAAERGKLESALMLIKAGTNPDFQGDRGLTALMLAASTNQPEVVALLLGIGANPNLKNESGKTAWDIAKSNKHKKVIQLLEVVIDVPLREFEEVPAIPTQEQSANPAREWQREMEEVLGF